jgi:hypothetical protein
MPEQRQTSDEPTAVGDPHEHPRQPVLSDPSERDTWFEEAEELPPRPRRRVLAPLPLALLAALAIACGFIAGVLVEKGQEGGSGSTAGAGGAFASRLAALRGGTGSSSAGGGSSSSSSTGSGSAGTGPSAGAGSSTGARGLAGAAGGTATVGQVAYADKGTLYVTTSEGNTVKVKAAAGASVTKTVKASIKAIHPGETVIVAGTSSASGAISASSIRVGSIAGAIDGGSALFGGSGATATGASSRAGGSRGSSASASEPQLFGKG